MGGGLNNGVGAGWLGDGGMEGEMGKGEVWIPFGVWIQKESGVARGR